MKPLTGGVIAGFLAVAALLLAVCPPGSADTLLGDLGRPRRTAAPAAYAVTGDRSQHICWRAGSGTLLELWTREGDAAGWHVQDLTQEAGAPPALGSPAAYSWSETRTEHVVYRGQDEQIHELYRPEGGRWAHAELSGPAGAPAAAGDPAAYVEEGNQIQHVLYRSADAEIIELYVRAGDATGWHVSNLTQNTSAPRATGDLAVLYWRETRSQHVFFRGEDGGLHELYLVPNGKWTHEVVTAEARGGKEAGDPAAFEDPGSKTERVLYRSGDGDLIEMVGKYGDKRSWQEHNLTAETSAPRSAGKPTGYVLRSGTLRRTETQHIVFRADDGSVHELYQGGGTGPWRHADLSAQTSAPRVGADPAGYVLEADRTQHVVYRTEEGGLYELYNTPSGPEAGWHGHELWKAALSPASP